MESRTYANATLVAGIALTIVLATPPAGRAAQASPAPDGSAASSAPAAPRADHDHEHPEPVSPGGGTPTAPGARSAAPT